MSKMNEPESFEEKNNDGVIISKTGLDMSEIISVLEGKSIVFEIDKSPRTQTDEIAAALMGDRHLNSAQEQSERESDRNYLGDDLEQIDFAKEKIGKVELLLDELESNMYKVLQEQSVEYYTPLQKIGGFKGKLTYKVRSFMRKFLEYIFAPILKQQNSLNSWVARTEEKNVEVLRNYTAALREECLVEIKVQEKRNQILEEKLMKQERLLEETLEEIKMLKQN